MECKKLYCVVCGRVLFILGGEKYEVVKGHNLFFFFFLNWERDCFTVA